MSDEGEKFGWEDDDDNMHVVILTKLQVKETPNGIVLLSDESFTICGVDIQGEACVLHALQDVSITCDGCLEKEGDPYLQVAEEILDKKPVVVGEPTPGRSLPFTHAMSIYPYRGGRRLCRVSLGG